MKKTAQFAGESPDTLMAMFEEFVSDRERGLAEKAAKSLQAIYADGTTVKQRYRQIFERSLEQGNLINIARNMYRTPFQVDRDRILYSGYFGRLACKTQVVITRGRSAENRLSHTLKVAQIARSICSGLKLNSDLAEAIALGHDIGHPPFGHAGEKAISSWLQANMPKSKNFLAFGAEPPILSEIKFPVDLVDTFFQGFAIGNDPKETLFQHGRQGVKLLTTHYKDSTRPKFCCQTLFGIWRHSLRDLGIEDEHFRCHDGLGIKLDGQARTLETVVVRYADDIASIYDLLDCLLMEVVKSEDVRKELRKLDSSSADGFDVIDSYFDGFLQHINYGSIGPILTAFISDIIQNSDVAAGSIRMSNLHDGLLSNIRATVKERIHERLKKVDRLSAQQPAELAGWYLKNPGEFIKDYNRKVKLDKTFPYRARFPWFADCEKLTLDKMQSKDTRAQTVALAAVISDFVACLTDDEVRSHAEAPTRGLPG